MKDILIVVIIGLLVCALGIWILAYNLNLSFSKLLAAICGILFLKLGLFLVETALKYWAGKIHKKEDSK